MAGVRCSTPTCSTEIPAVHANQWPAHSDGRGDDANDAHDDEAVRDGGGEGGGVDGDAGDAAHAHDDRATHADEDDGDDDDGRPPQSRRDGDVRRPR